jgi:hypothetical protein
VRSASCISPHPNTTPSQFHIGESNLHQLSKNGTTYATEVNQRDYLSLIRHGRESSLIIASLNLPPSLPSMAQRSKSHPTDASELFSTDTGSLTRWIQYTCGSIRIVSTGTERDGDCMLTRSDPVIYVPLPALTSGPAEVSKDKTDERGFWTGSLQLRGRCVEVAGFDKGPLDGLVKIPADLLGKWIYNTLLPPSA